MGRTRNSWGAMRTLPSGKIQASYTGPDLRRHLAPTTFSDRMTATVWLANVRRTIEDGTWSPYSADASPESFGDYARQWLQGRTLKPRTREHYAKLLNGRILPEFGGSPLKAITPPRVRQWFEAQGDATPTARAHAYALLRTILQSALEDELITANPCRVRGGSTVKRAKAIRPATLAELEVIAEQMPERLRAMVMLAAWCALRFGELAELRRQDIDMVAGVVRVRRGVTRVAGVPVVGTPKSTAGIRDVAIPPHLLPMMQGHLDRFTGGGGKALLFPAADGRNYSPGALDHHWHRAREAAGRPDLRFHDLRHTGAVLAASTGATLAELMARLGHTSPAMAMRYQHAAQDRDRAIAEALSGIARGGSA